MGFYIYNESKLSFRAKFMGKKFDLKKDDWARRCNKRVVTDSGCPRSRRFCTICDALDE